MIFAEYKSEGHRRFYEKPGQRLYADNAPPERCISQRVQLLVAQINDLSRDIPAWVQAVLEQHRREDSVTVFVNTARLWRAVFKRKT